MKIHFIFGFFLKIAAQNNGFQNIKTRWFNYKQTDVIQDTKTCDFCTKSLWSAILNISTNSENSSDFTISIIKEKELEEAHACEDCYIKMDIFKEIENNLVDCSFIPTLVENLNYLECKYKESDCYLTVKINREDYILAINNNTVESVDNLIFLVKLIEDNSNKILKMPDQTQEIISLFSKIKVDKIEKITKLTPEEEEKNIHQQNTTYLSYLRKDLFLNKELNVNSELRQELHKGKPWFTLKNLGIAILAYYIIGFILVVLYYNLTDKQNNIA